jgi:hypothetical protein
MITRVCVVKLNTSNEQRLLEHSEKLGTPMQCATGMGVSNHREPQGMANVCVDACTLRTQMLSAVCKKVGLHLHEANHIGRTVHCERCSH